MVKQLEKMCIFYIQQNSTGSQNAGSLKIGSNTEVKTRAHSKHEPDMTRHGSQNAGSNKSTCGPPEVKIGHHF